VIDDILDVVGDPEALGKPVGADVAQGRGAFVVQGAANHTGEENGRTILSLHAGGEPAVAEKESDPIAAMMSKLRTSGAIELARMQAVEVIERARWALELVPPSAARDELERLTYEVIERDR